MQSSLRVADSPPLPPKKSQASGLAWSRGSNHAIGGFLHSNFHLCFLCILPNFLLKMWASFIQAWEKERKLQAVQFFHHSSSATPVKSKLLSPSFFLPTLGRYLVWPLVEIWWIVYPPLGLISAVPRGKGPGDRRCFQGHVMVRHKTVHVHGEGECEVDALPSTTLTLFPITLSARIQGHIRLLWKIWGDVRWFKSQQCKQSRIEY